VSYRAVTDLLDRTNLLASGKVLAIVGWNEDAARTARAMRARVVIADGPDEARLRGYDVLPLVEALADAELVLAREVDPALLRADAVVGGGVRLDGDEVRAGVVEHVRDDGTSVFVVETSPL
jgi:S-adenosylhomocysteine hydrolase